MEDPFTPQLPSLVSTVRVPNVFPVHSAPYRIAIVGEAPGTDEEAYGIPFCGASGKLLDAILGGVGIMRTACFVGNVCQHRPPGNKIEAFGYDHPLVQEGKANLLRELATFNPNVVLCLGNTPMWALTGKPFGLRGSGWGISDAAGFIWNAPPYKLVASYHPASCFHGDYRNWVSIKHSCHRALEEGHTKELVLPQRVFDLDLSASAICAKLDSWPAGLPASIDIEGTIDSWICLSVVSAPDYGFIIAFAEHTLDEQARIYASVSRFLYRDDIPKVLQNSLYEGFVLGYRFQMAVRNVADDTMLKQWELHSELPKGLDTVAAMWTREPQWKFLIAYSKTEQKRRMALPDYNPRQETLNKFRACCIDSAVTLEANRGQENALSQQAKAHYRFNMSCLSPILYMELKGFAYNKPLALLELGQVTAAMAETDSRLEIRAGYSLTGSGGGLSPLKLKRCLYEEKNYPVQRKGRGPTAPITADTPALLKIKQKFPNDAFLNDILLYKKLESVKETLEVQTDTDGRVRCGYNLVGTETGRLTCYTSPTGSGANLQTITKKLRKLYVADSDHWLFQCDLSGADGWTVAAHCLKHGDSTMWDDYRFGLKPAKILALMYEHGADATVCTREELALRCDTVDGDSMIYFACKRIQHGTNYGMKEKTMAQQIMEDSYKLTGQAIYIEPKICAELQRLYLIRYPGIHYWHNWAKRQVLDGHDLTAASGHTRIFYGRRKSWNPKFRSVEADHDTWKEFLATEPQDNTTYANNLAMKNMWYDTENRRDGLFLENAFDTLRATQAKAPGGLYIQPIHSVHDAIIGLFERERTDWAIQKIDSYYMNPLTIANTQVTIPFEGTYGPSWGEQGPKYGGGKI